MAVIIKKGHLLVKEKCFEDFVIVGVYFCPKTTDVYVSCIDTGANNVWSFSLCELIEDNFKTIDPKDLHNQMNFENPLEDGSFIDINWSLVAEVMLGLHDDRFFVRGF